MPLFALPLAHSSITQHAESKTSRVKFSNLPVRKRKRSRATEESSDDDNSSLNGDAAPAATNPLSLTPLEIAQYQLAGLDLDQELPDVKGFPHRALPQNFGSRDKKWRGRGRRDTGGTDIDEEENRPEEEQEEERVERISRGPWLRNQHLSVLTTILHRCLGEGDIQRASRAWAMLLRMQISGTGIDIRSNGYWEVGAGLLMRSLDKRRKYSYDDEESDVEEEDVMEEDTGVEKRWGSREGLKLAKSFYERLILEFPYNRQFQRSVSALDFWPAMVGCEIYGVQIEQKEGLRKVEKQEEKDDEEDGSGDESLDSHDVEEEDPEEDIFTINRRRKEKLRRIQAEKRWAERDEVRQTALVASEKIAAKLDEIMTTPPYSDSHNLLRLRGMLALYIGDLSVPAMPLEQDEDDNEASRRNSQRLGELDKNTEGRFLYRRRVAEHERGQKTQGAERERAAKLFDRIISDGGEDEDIRDFSLGMIEPGEEGEDADGQGV